MRLKQHISLYVLLLAFVLPVSEGGCNTTDEQAIQACFSWTQAAGACPAQANAINSFTTHVCTFTIVSVDSDGTAADWDGDGQGDHCCYEVTAVDIDEEGPECF